MKRVFIIVPALLTLILLMLTVAPQAYQPLGPKSVVVSVHSKVRVMNFTKPTVASGLFETYKSIYVGCHEKLSSRSIYYIGTLYHREGGLMISLFKPLNTFKALIVYHEGNGKVLYCTLIKLRLLSSGGKNRNLSKGIKGTYRYSIYELNIPGIPLEILKEVTYAGNLSQALRDAKILSNVVIIEEHVEGIMRYTYLGGEYDVHLKGIVWIKKEPGGSREVVNAVERGSYGELKGAMKYLYSVCEFKAWAEHNEFVAMIKGSWMIAENTCPLTDRCRGRPVLTVYANGNIDLDPGGGKCNLELGCGCYAP